MVSAVGPSGLIPRSPRREAGGTSIAVPTYCCLRRDRYCSGAATGTALASTSDNGGLPSAAWDALLPEPGRQLARRGREQIDLAAAAPLDEHRRGIVLELSRLALDDGLAEPTQRLGSGLPGGRLALDELAET